MSTVIDTSLTVESDTITASLTVDGDAITSTISSNPRGPKGDTGATGATGAAGPNSVSTSTSTNITGAIWGTGTLIRQGVAGTDYLSPSGAATLYLAKASNLSDLASASTARTNLGLGTAAVVNTGTTAGTLLLLGVNGSIQTTSTDAYILTSGANAGFYTEGADATIGTTGINASIGTSGANASITTSGSDAYIATFGARSEIYTQGIDGVISTAGARAHIRTGGGGHIETSSTFKITNGSFTTTLSGTQTANRAISFPDGSGTLAIGSGTGGAIVSADITDAATSAMADSVVRRSSTGSAEFSSTGGVALFSEDSTTGIGVEGASASGIGVRASTQSGLAIELYSGGGDMLRASNAGTPDVLVIDTTGGITSLGDIVGQNLSGTNTGDQTNITGNAGTATALQTARTIFGQSFNGTADVNGNLLTNGHLASVPSGGEAGHLVTLNGTAPTIVAGRSAWWSNGSGVPSFRNGTGSAVTLVCSSDLGANVATFLTTPTSANLAAAVTNETGSGSLVFGTSPTLTTPTINTGILGSAVPSLLQNQAGTTRPICVLFEDFPGISGSGTHPWNDSGTGSTDASSTGGSGNFLGTCRLLTGTTSGNARTRSLGIATSTIFIGAIVRYGFAIPDITNVNISIGFSAGGSNCQLYYASASNSGQWTLLTNAGVTTFTTETPQAGNYFSGKRYQVEVERISATQTRILLEIADHNLANWSTVYSGTITHSSVSANWGECTPSFRVDTQTNAARSLVVDWASLHLPMILR